MGINYNRIEEDTTKKPFTLNCTEKYFKCYCIALHCHKLMSMAAITDNNAR